MLLNYLNCEDCQKDFEFSDEINKNNANFSKEECDDYQISFIKKNIDDIFEYTIIFTCKKCKNKINKTFREKEANFHFKCEKCPLKGINFNYFLSQEDDAYLKNDSNNPSHTKGNNVLKPLNSLSDLTPVIYGNKSNKNTEIKDIDQKNVILEFNPFKNDKSDKNDIINNNLTNPEVNNNPKNVIPLKRYSTPNEEKEKEKEEEEKIKEEEKEKEEEEEEKIKIIFVKNKQKYPLYFKPSDSINNKINYIKQNIDLGNNPVFLYNSNEIDKNKSFRENKIISGFLIEIEEE